MTAPPPTASALTIEKLNELYEYFAKTPLLRIIVSRHALPDTSVEIPAYYDKSQCREVRVFILGANTWKRLIAECPVDSTASRIGGTRVEFSPPEWRP